MPACTACRRNTLSQALSATPQSCATKASQTVTHPQGIAIRSTCTLLLRELKAEAIAATSDSIVRRHKTARGDSQIRNPRVQSREVTSSDVMILLVHTHAAQQAQGSHTELGVAAPAFRPAQPQTRELLGGRIFLAART